MFQDGRKFQDGSLGYKVVLGWSSRMRGSFRIEVQDLKQFQGGSSRMEVQDVKQFQDGRVGCEVLSG